MKKLFSKMMLVTMAVAAFVACEDVPEPYDIPGTGYNKPGSEEIEGATGDGSLENPFNAIAATNEAKKLGSGGVSEESYYIKGKVVSIATDKNGNVLNYDQGTFGNASFYISDDGTSTNQFYCYRVLYLGNKKWTQGAGDILKVGDEVIVYAKITMYNSTPETQQNDGFLYSLNGKSEGGVSEGGEATGDGSLENPFNSVAANNAASKLAKGEVSDKSYYIKGKVASIPNDKNGQPQNFDNGNFGNATFYISDDGTAVGQFYCYRVLYLGNKKWTQGSGDLLKEGDDVIICAKLTNYNGTFETQQNEGYLYSLNGKTEGNDNPDPQPSGEVKKVSTADFTAAEVSNDVWYELTGKVTNLKDGDQYGNFDLVDETGSVYVYGLLSEKGGAKKQFQDLVAAKGIKEGCTITIIGNRGDYQGKIEVTNAYFVSIEGGGDTPDPQPGGEAKVVTVAEFNAAEVSNDIWYQLTGTVKNLKDGDQYGNFDLEDETGSVYVYGLLDKKGGEKKKFQDLVAAKGIKEGCKLTIIGNRGEYNGKIEVMNAYFVSIEGGGDPNPGGGGDNPGGGGQAAKEGTNGDFESWTGDVPDNWKTASTAGNATLSKSTDAHGGSYSVKVGGASQNKRLAYKEMQLKAGNYTMKFYVKAATAEGGSVRPGFVAVNNGTADSSGYKYGDYVNDLTNTSWVEVTHSFDIPSDGTYCVLIMNSKNPGKDVLIDDFTLVSGSNTIIK